MLLCAGQNQTVDKWLTAALPGHASLPALLARAGFTVIAGDLGLATWGNATGTANIDRVRRYAATLGCPTDKLLLVGASQGAYNALAYMAAYPGRVAAMVGILPACDLDDLRDNNRLGTIRDIVNTAWGLPPGSSSATDPLPAGANVSDPTVAARIAASGPVLLAYSTADAVVMPSTVTTLAARIGSSCTTVVADTTSGHTDTTIGLAAALTDGTKNLITQFLDSHA